MGKITESAEDAKFIFDNFNKVIRWASETFLKRFLILLLLAISIVGAQYLYLNNLLEQTKKSSERHVLEVKLLTKENLYKTALDSINLCMSAQEKKLKNADWYCENAIYQYRDASKNWPPEGIKKVIDKLAYGAMKIDVSHYIRSIKFSRLVNTPPTKAQELLDLMLSKTMIIIVIGCILFVFTLFFIMLLRASKHRKE